MTRLSVPDMSCGHCKSSVTSALNALAGAGTVEVDLDRKEVAVSGDVAAEALVASLAAIGFPAQVIAAK